jgi:phosphotransferase system HPr-like phosphotransfer protein
MKLTISLDTIDKVKNFVNTIFHYAGDADLRSGRYTVDAKSILGIFSLDLSHPLELELHGSPDPALLEELQRYCV